MNTNNAGVETPSKASMSNPESTVYLQHEDHCPMGRGEARLRALCLGIPEPNFLRIVVITGMDDEKVSVEMLTPQGEGTTAHVVFDDGAQFEAVHVDGVCGTLPREMVAHDANSGTVLLMEIPPRNEDCWILTTAKLQGQ